MNKETLEEHTAQDPAREQNQDLLERGLHAHQGEASRVRATSLESLELDLIHLSCALERYPLKLNKSGTPNRRSLARFCQGIVMPSQQLTTDGLDLQNPEEIDYLAFLLALLLELGILHCDEQNLTARAHHEPAQRHFTHHEERRNRTLSAAVRNLKHWSEVISAQLSGEGSPSEHQVEAQLSLTQTNGAPLIGARGYLLSVLKRAAPAEWTCQDDLIELCLQLDRDYLPRVLNRTSSPLEPAQYVALFIEHMLFWLGIVELAQDKDDHTKLVRLTPRGQRWLETHDAPALPEGAHAPCLIIQPNLEIMVFLDAAPIPVLFKLYKLAERATLADRVATFKLGAESVQRGYSLGLDAAKAIAFFDKHSHTPLDQTLRFQLEDWERVWQRLTLFADGLLLRHQDPDAFDIILGHLQHEWREVPELQFIRLSHGSAFVTSPTLEPLTRTIERYPNLIIDHLGYIPPCLHFNDLNDPLSFEVNPLHCDFVTSRELEQVAAWERERSKPFTRQYSLDIERIKAKWPEDPLGAALTWLRPRATGPEGGMPPATELTLRALLRRPQPRAQLAHDILVIHFNDAHSAELFGAIPAAQEIIVDRLGEHSFGVLREDEHLLQELLTQLNIPFS